MSACSKLPQHKHCFFKLRNWPGFLTPAQHNHDEATTGL